MNTIESKTNLGSSIVSKTIVADVVSKIDNLPQSKSSFYPISVAQNIPGADVISSMAGAFSACVVGDDWKDDVVATLNSIPTA